MKTSALAPTVVADDLTGACEIAALGFRRGLRSIVTFDPASRPEGADLWVLDSETRLLPPTAAAERLRQLLAPVTASAEHPVFKKIDSVLRGPVQAEVQVFLEHFQRSVALVAPANPALGRVLLAGHYLIDGQPLDATAFAQDAHHPATSASVEELLATPDGLPVHSLRRSAPIPPAGLAVADAENDADLEIWATRACAAPHCLPVGGAAFFDRVLAHWAPGNLTTPPTPQPPHATLLLSGTLDPKQHALLVRSAANRGPAVALRTPFEDSVARARTHGLVHASLQNTGVALAFVDAAPGEADPAALRAAFANLAATLLSSGAVRHLVIEGGATAAAIAEALGWTSLTVIADWGGGTVSLAPTEDPELWVTLKPGSYPWPRALAGRLFSPAQPATTAPLFS